ncbi:hypothetical protein Tco_1062376 [Tanacetum coccineum]
MLSKVNSGQQKSTYGQQWNPHLWEDSNFLGSMGSTVWSVVSGVVRSLSARSPKVVKIASRMKCEDRMRGSIDQVMMIIGWKVKTTFLLNGRVLVLRSSKKSK